MTLECVLFFIILCCSPVPRSFLYDARPFLHQNTVYLFCMNSFQIWIKLFFDCAIAILFFFIFDFSILLIENKISLWLDSDLGSLVSEATTLPTEPHPLPNKTFSEDRPVMRPFATYLLHQ